MLSAAAIAADVVCTLGTQSKSCLLAWVLANCVGMGGVAWLLIIAAVLEVDGHNGG